MISMFRLKGRGFLIGNFSLTALVVLTGAVFVFCLNLLPEVVLQVSVSYLPNVNGDLIVAAVSLLLLAVIFLFCSVVSLGTDRFFLRKAQNRGGGVKDIFYYFHPKKVFSAAAFVLRLFAVKLLLLIFCNTPTFLCLFLLVSIWQTSASVKVSLILLVSILAFAANGMYFYCKISSSLFLSRYYYIEGIFLNFRHIISCSQNTMKDKKKTLSKLRISFWGWFISCLLVFPAVYVFCYYRQTLSVAANDFMNK